MACLMASPHMEEAKLVNITSLIPLVQGKTLGALVPYQLTLLMQIQRSVMMLRKKYQSYRFRYNKNINDIGTNIALAGYRYSTKGFYSLAEVFDGYRDTNYAPEIERRRNRGEITLSQNLGDSFGSISVGYINEDYWNSDRKTQSATVGYNNSWQGVSYSLNYTYNKNTNSYSYRSGSRSKSEDDHQLALSVSVPFSVFDDTFYYNFNSSSSSNSASTGSIGLSASQLNNRLNWSVQQGFTTRDQGTNGNMNASYKSTIW